MKRDKNFLLSSMFLLLLIPGIALNDVFAEKLVVSVGQFGESAQFSVIDKTTGLESEVLGDDNIIVVDGETEFSLLLGGIHFTQNGLIGSSNVDGAADQFGFHQISFTVDEGERFTIAKVIDETFNGFFCYDISTAPDGTLYCVSDDPNSVTGLYTIDLDAGTSSLIASTGITDESSDYGLAIGSDGTIYLGNEIGLYTLDPVTETSTLVVLWDTDGDGEMDEPNFDDTPSEEDPFGLIECPVSAMDFDSSEILYATIFCDEEESFLVKIGLEPPTVIVDVEKANLTVYLMERNEDLEHGLSLSEYMNTDPMTFSPFDFDFLLGTTYGTVSDGYDSITALVTEDGNYIATNDAASIAICDNTELELSDGAELFAECNNTSVSVDSGSVIATLQADDEEVEQLMTTLSAGDAIVFDSLECELTNIGENDINVDFEGETRTITPGDTLSCLKVIDHYFGYKIEDKTRHHDDEKEVSWNLSADVMPVPPYGSFDIQNSDDKSELEVKSKKDSIKLEGDMKGLERNTTYTVFVSKSYVPFTTWSGLYPGVETFDFETNSKGKAEWKVNVTPVDGFPEMSVWINVSGSTLLISDNFVIPLHDDHEKIIVNLVDEFAGDVDYKVKKVERLFNPAQVTGGEEIGSEESHLVSYDIKKIKGEPKFEKMKNILVTNQFGDLTVDIKNPKQLLVPSAKSHDATPEELEKIVINHFKCYDAKESKKTPKFEKRTVDLDDQFGSVTMNVHKVKSLCSPVDKNSEGVVNEENYLMCYDLKKIKGEPKFKKLNVFTNNQFGPEELKVKKQKELCVPSTITLE